MPYELRDYSDSWDGLEKQYPYEHKKLSRVEYKKRKEAKRRKKLSRRRNR